MKVATVISTDYDQQINRLATYDLQEQQDNNIQATNNTMHVSEEQRKQPRCYVRIRIM
jgi:hypothetical protein